MFSIFFLSACSDKPNSKESIKLIIDKKIVISEKTSVDSVNFDNQYKKLFELSDKACSLSFF